MPQQDLVPKRPQRYDLGARRAVHHRGEKARGIRNGVVLADGQVLDKPEIALDEEEAGLVLGPKLEVRVRGVYEVDHLLEAVAVDDPYRELSGALTLGAGRAFGADGQAAYGEFALALRADLPWGESRHRDVVHVLRFALGTDQPDLQAFAAFGFK